MGTAPGDFGLHQPLLFPPEQPEDGSALQPLGAPAVLHPGHQLQGFGARAPPADSEWQKKGQGPQLGQPGLPSPTAANPPRLASTPAGKK